LRHLRARQIRALVRRRVIGRAAARLGAHLPWAPAGRRFAGRAGLRRSLAAIRFPEWEPEQARRLLETREFRFLNHGFRAGTAIPWSGEPLIGSVASGQTVKALPKLWLYHLNYCDFLNLDLSRPDDASWLASALDIAADWLRRNPRGSRIAWDPYPLSLRVVNWLKFVARNARAAEAVGRGADVRKMVESIADQVSWLRDQIEEDLGGNHLVKNAKALLFAGVFLDCAESGRWWDQGSALLARELDEQVLADGGHVERSPMYHCQVLEDLLDVEALTAATLQPLACMSGLQAAIARMTWFLRAILHPDGEIPLLNDAAFGMAAPARSLLTRASALQTDLPDDSHGHVKGLPVKGALEPSVTATILADTGYAVLRNRASSSFAILDCGPLGPDYQPGHGHCDLLSHELSLQGQRIAVDTGVSTYQCGSERLYERSTAAHNTIRIDGEEQAEIWASFRVGRRPTAGRMESGDCESSMGRITWVRGRHFAYAHRNIVHTRTIAATATNIWLVIDALEGQGWHQADSFIHFHPSVAVESWSGERNLETTVTDCVEEEAKGLRPAYVLTHAGKRYALVASGACETALGSSWYAPRFGRQEWRPMISWMWQGELPARFIYALAPLGGATTRVDDLAAALLEATSLFPDRSLQPLSMHPRKRDRRRMNGLLRRSISPWFKHATT
jgi:uncharacterized heparinase superfamily protein